MPPMEIVSSSVVSGILLGGMLALIALGLSISLGVMRLVNLAHGEFLILGAYFGYYLTALLGLDPLLGLPIVAVTVGVLALPFQRILIAPIAAKGMEAPMMTMFGVSIILQNAFLLSFSADSRAIDAAYAARPVTFGPVVVPEIYIIGFAIAVMMVIGMHALVTKTAFGRELRASSDDAVAAGTMGVDVRRVHAITFALGTACAAIGGVLLGITFSFTPSTGATYLLISFAVVVLGGVGNILGTLVAGISLGLMQSIGALVLGDGYRDFIGLVIFLLALGFRPTGMVSAGAR